MADKKDMAEKMEKNQKFELSANSLDFYPPDFFLWGYLKDRIFANKPKSIFDVKVSIREEIRGSSRFVWKMRNTKLRHTLEKNVWI